MSSNVVPWIRPPGSPAQQLRAAARSQREYAEFNRGNGWEDLADLQEAEAARCDAMAETLEGEQCTASQT